jgi:hypothetical protein
MKNEELQIFLKLAISNIQLACARVEIDHPSAQYSDSERRGMVTAYTEVANDLVKIVDNKSIRPQFLELFDKWFETLSSYQEGSSSSFESGYVRALRHSIGDMEYVLDE